MCPDISGVHASERYFADLKQIELQFLNSGGEFVVGEHEGQIVAIGGLKKTSAVRAEITRMRVHLYFQRRGFGRMVLSFLEARAIELGYRTLHLDTTLQQDQAQRFYLHSGYHQVATGTKAGYAVVYFEKEF